MCAASSVIERLAASIENSTLAVVPDVGHTALMQSPVEIAATVKAFIA